MVSLEKTTSKVGLTTDRVRKIIESRQEPIRAIVKSGTAQEIIAQDCSIVNALHAIAEIYTSADFSRMTEEDAQFTLEEMKNFVIEHYSMLSVSELREAFSLAASKKIKGDLRAWNGKFTVSMVGEVLSSYLKYSNKVVQEYQDQQKLLSRAKTQDEKDERNEKTKKDVISTYLELKEQYKENLEIDEKKIFLHWGKILVESGYIKFDIEQKRDILKEAEELVKEEIKRELIASKDPNRRRDLIQVVKVLDDKSKKKPEKFKNRVESKYSTLIVKKSIING